MGRFGNEKIQKLQKKFLGFPGHFRDPSGMNDGELSNQGSSSFLIKRVLQGQRGNLDWNQDNGGKGQGPFPPGNNLKNDKIFLYAKQ